MKIRDGFYFGIGLALSYVCFKFATFVFWLMLMKAAGIFVGLMP